MKEVQTFESFNQDLADSVGGFLENPLTQKYQKMKKSSFWFECL